MEALKGYFDDVEKKYEEFVEIASEIACYAEEHPEIDYTGSLETVNAELDPVEVDQMLEQELIGIQNLSLEIQDKFQKLSKEMKRYREVNSNLPDEYYSLGEQVSKTKMQFNELDAEITDIMRQFDHADSPELKKQRSIIGTREAEQLAGNIPFEPKR